MTADTKNDTAGTPFDAALATVGGALSPLQLLGLTALAIFVAEALIMFVMPFIEPLPVALMAILDALLLTLLAAPFLYYLLFRPMVLHIRIREQAEAALLELNESLEQRVADRTDELNRSMKTLTHEIRERKATEERLRRSNDFVQRLIESAPCIMATVDASNLRCNYVNGRIEDLLGVSPDDVAASSHTFFDLVAPPASLERCRGIVRELIVAPEGEILRDTWDLRHADGSSTGCRVALVVSSRTAIGEPEEILFVATPLDECD